MDKISIVMPIPFNSSRECIQYIPIIQTIKEKGRFGSFYGLKTKFDKNIVSNYECNIHLTMWPYMKAKFFKLLKKRNNYPKYFSFFIRLETFDYWASKKIKRDSAQIIYIDMLLPKTAIEAKKAGKTVVVMTGNSNPAREYSRIIQEYEKYKIKNKYLYGDKKYRDRCILSLENCDYFIAISKVSAETYRNADYDMSKCRVIPKTGTDFKIYKCAQNIERKKAFVTTAFHCFIKGTHRLLCAWEKARIQDISLHVVGPLNDDMKEFVEKYGPFENVIFDGAMRREELIEFYKNLDAVGILLSLSEGAGRVTPEMMSFGFPMIVSPDATCDMILDNYNGFVVDPEDENEIIVRLKWFAEDWENVHSLNDNVYSSVVNQTLNDFAIDVAQLLLAIK